MAQAKTCGRAGRRPGWGPGHSRAAAPRRAEATIQACSVVASAIYVERVDIPTRAPRELPEPVVGLEQLCCVADVAPVPGGPVAVDRNARHEPCDEPAGLIGEVALVEIPA